MARIKLVEQNEATGAEKERYDELAGRNAVTNMKKGLLNDAATYDAYMAWYTSWNRLVEVIGEKDAILYAHKISTTNSCQLCSLFFISDVMILVRLLFTAGRSVDWLIMITYYAAQLLFGLSCLL